MFMNSSSLLLFPFPQYLGDTTPPAVKERIKELLYSWKVGLPHEGKINEAYLMLKREGKRRESGASFGGTLFLLCHQPLFENESIRRKRIRGRGGSKCTYRDAVFLL